MSANTNNPARYVFWGGAVAVVVIVLALFLTNNRYWVFGEKNVEANATHDAIEGINKKFASKTGNIGDRYNSNDPDARRDLAFAKLQRRGEVEGVKDPNLKLCEGAQLKPHQIPAFIRDEYMTGSGDILWQVSEGCKQGQPVGIFFSAADVTADVSIITPDGGVLPKPPKLSPSTPRDKATFVADKKYQLGGAVIMTLDRQFERGYYVLYKINK